MKWNSVADYFTNFLFVIIFHNLLISKGWLGITVRDRERSSNEGCRLFQNVTDE
jgi:hypothetical protein